MPITDVEEATKLDDDEKSILIQFYKEHDLLWRTGNPFYKNKEKRAQVKRQLVESFSGKFSIHTLEKCFHSLRTCHLRESKKLLVGNYFKKKWKFFDELSFLQENNRIHLEPYEITILIDFFKNNPSLWNKDHPHFANENVSNQLTHQLIMELDEKLTWKDIHFEWQILCDTFKQEREKIKNAEKWGNSAITSSWIFYSQLEFLNENESTVEYSGKDNQTKHIRYDDAEPHPTKKRKRSLDKAYNKQESTNYVPLDPVVSPLSPPYNTINHIIPFETIIMENAQIFGKMITSNLLQYDPKHWSVLKKKIMDVFVDFEEKNEIAFRGHVPFEMQYSISEDSIANE